MIYHEMTPFIVLICNKKRVHEIETANNVAENFNFTSQGMKIIFLPTQLCKLQFHQIYVSFASFSNAKYFQCFVLSSSLNRLDTLGLIKYFVLIKYLPKLAMHRTGSGLSILLKQQINGKFNIKTIILVIPLSFYLLTISKRIFLTNCASNLYLVI